MKKVLLHVNRSIKPFTKAQELTRPMDACGILEYDDDAVRLTRSVVERKPGKISLGDLTNIHSDNRSYCSNYNAKAKP